MKSSWRNAGAAVLAASLAHATAAGCGDVNGDITGRAADAPSGCRGDADCTPGAQRCELSSGTCVPCLASSDCADGRVCAVPANRCVPSCVGSDICSGSAPLCDAATGTCRACATALDCPDATPFCLASGACAQCLDADDCNPASDTPFCDVTAGRCVECVEDGHCDDVEESCNRVLGECAEPCSPTRLCNGDDPICDPALGFCVECEADGDCEDEALCRGSECVEEDEDDDEDDEEENDD